MGFCGGRGREKRKIITTPTNVIALDSFHSTEHGACNERGTQPPPSLCNPSRSQGRATPDKTSRGLSNELFYTHFTGKSKAKRTAGRNPRRAQQQRSTTKRSHVVTLGDQWQRSACLTDLLPLGKHGSKRGTEPPASPSSRLAAAHGTPVFTRSALQRADGTGLNFQ